MRKVFKRRTCFTLTLVFVALIIYTRCNKQHSLLENRMFNTHFTQFQEPMNSSCLCAHEHQVTKRRILKETELKDFLMNNCNENPENVVIQLENTEKYLSFTEYKKDLAYNFTSKYKDPVNKTKSLGELSFRVGWITPNPRSRLHDPHEQINVYFLNNLVKKETKLRILLGDDDPLQIPEVLEELKTSKYKVPNILHFIWFGSERRFRVDHYMAFVGALRYQQPKVILFHHNAIPVGEYWKIATRFAGVRLRMVKRTPPTKIFSHNISVVAHQADVARLQIMMEIGGIYIDTDSVFLKSVDIFRNFEMVLPESDWATLANGIILANRNAWFLRRWFHEYKYFIDDVWGLNSVLVPWGIAQYFPRKIRVVKGTMCRPSWSEIELIYKNIINWSHIYIMHLYSRQIEAEDGILERPLKQLAVLHSTYGQVARHVIWGDKRIRDVTNWIVTCNLTQSLTMGKKMPSSSQHTLRNL